MCDRLVAGRMKKGVKKPFFSFAVSFFDPTACCTPSESFRPNKRQSRLASWLPPLQTSTLALFIITAILVTNCRGRDYSSQERERPLAIAVAANALYAMQEIEAAFEKKEGNSIELVSTSSGKLSTQIVQGAPYHLFISADMKYPDFLYRAGAAAAPPKPYAYGALVLWSMRPDLPIGKGIEVLSDPSVKKIAIANPETAPYGAEAIRAIESTDIAEEVFPRLVYGESIGQTSQYISSGACDIGITAKSVVLAPEMAGKGQWTDVDSSLYQAIAQGAVITNFGQKAEPERSRLFFDYLFSDEARQIFMRYGYRLP